MNLLDYMVEKGLRLERRGLDWWCSCPFHRDDTPSMHVTEKDGSYAWYCFSCKRGGGPAEFVAEMEGLPPWEARRKWALETGQELPDGDREALTAAVALLECGGHPFLRSRGVSDETAKRFGIGYCEDYGRFLAAAGLDKKHAERLGLFDFTGCMVYPFYDHEGCYKVAARSVEGKSYRTSPESSAFFRDGLWGMHLLRGPEAWVFEGYHDAMVASQYGYQALAAAGTNMPARAWRELKDRGVERMVFVPDGDAGGRSWLSRLAVEAPPDVVVEFVALTSGDPDDALLAGADLRNKVVTPFQWALSTGDMGSLAEKVRTVRSCSKAFLRMPRDQRALSKAWFKEAYGDDEALDWLRVDQEPDLESERTVLANCLYSPGARAEAVGELEVGFFNTKAHRSVFSLIKEREATPQMVSVELGFDLSGSADLANSRYYLERVKDAGIRAKVSKIVASASPSDVGKLVEDLLSVSGGPRVSDGSELVARSMERVNERVKSPGLPGVEIRGFPTLNKVLLGWNRGRLIFVSGNAKNGKTTLACNFLDGVVDDHGCLFFTLEMSEDEITDKVIGVRSGIPSMKMVTGSLEQFEYDLVLEAAKSLRKGNLRVVGGMSDLYKIVATARSQVMRHKIRFVFLDYVQLVTLESRADRWEQLASITKTLKNQLCPLGVTVIALTQLGKNALRSDVPDASDQAGAYAMLADADTAITLRQEDPKETKDGSNFTVSVSRNRHGMDGIVIPCLFDKATQRIREL